MSENTENFDYYEVLGLTKEAKPSKEDIKKAYQKVCMSCHPDMVKLKPWPQAQKDAAIVKFKQATKAEEVLSDPSKRAAYDMYGLKGVENLGAGKNAASGRTYAEVAGPIVERKMPTTEDTMEFFEKRAALRERSEGKPDTGPGPDREAARLARLARRGKGNDGTPSAPSTPSAPDRFDNSSSSNAFRDVADKVSDASDALRGGVSLPVDVLVKFRENLADFLGEVDKAIVRAKTSGGPNPR